MQNKLIILGASGNALDVMDVVDALNAAGGGTLWEIAGILDDRRTAAGEGGMFGGVPIIGKISDAAMLAGEPENYVFLCAIGSDRSFRRRAELIETAGIPAERFATLVHPQAGVSPRAKLGRGVCVHFGASVAGNVQVGDHVTLGPRTVVGHDSQIGAQTLTAAGAVISGGVQIGRGCYLGSSCCIRQQRSVGDGALVGMGAVVVRDVPAGMTVVGNPARVLLKHAEAAATAG